jgi:hypothetical protein
VLQAGWILYGLNIRSNIHALRDQVEPVAIAQSVRSCPFISRDLNDWKGRAFRALHLDADELSLSISVFDVPSRRFTIPGDPLQGCTLAYMERLLQMLDTIASARLPIIAACRASRRDPDPTPDDVPDARGISNEVPAAISDGVT